MRSPSSPVELLRYCKNLRNLRRQPNIHPGIKAEATKGFLEALVKNLGFPPEVADWDDKAVEMYLEIIITVGL